MILDIALGVIIVIVAAAGLRSGFVYTFLHTAGWLISLLCGFLLSGRVKAFLVSRESFYSSISENISRRIGESLPANSIQGDGIPRILNQLLNELSDNLSVSLTDALMSVIAFALVVLAVKFIFYILTMLFSKKGFGPLGFLDGILGLVFGLLKGFIIVYFLLAVMFPLVSLAGPDFSFSLLTTLDSSVIAKDLYHNNPLLLLL